MVQNFKAIVFLLFVLLMFSTGAKAQLFKLELVYKDKVSDALAEAAAVVSEFSGKDECSAYLRDQYLPVWRKKGFLEASIDSIIEEETKTKAWVHLGPKYAWGSIVLDSSLKALAETTMLPVNMREGVILNIEQLLSLQEYYLSLLEENGYPFASVFLDSSYFINNQLFAQLKANRGPLYSIDSIHIEGKVKVNPSFIARYLGLGEGAIYKKSVLDQVSKRIAELGFVRETRKWSLSLTGTGAILNLYLEPVKNSRFNLLAGFMPSNEQLGGKLLLTGEAEMDLKNVFGGGENLFLNWQQIQVRSPRLQLGFMKPYLFNSNTGVDFNFNLLRKDSTFLTLNTRIGLRYEIKPRQTAKLYFQQFTSSLLDIDTNRLKQTGRLPEFLDATTSNFGIDFNYNVTDFFLNPQKGVEMEFKFMGGIRRIKQNNAIAQLKGIGTGPENFRSLYDSISLNSSQFRLAAKVNHYLKIGKQSTLKTGLQTGWLLGKELLLNELFQIGGIRTLRGFDEESLFASGFAIGTIEYRFLLSQVSYLFGFVDGAYVERKTNFLQSGKFYGGAGLGISLETKTGLFSLAYAAGKRPDVPLNFREAKIHFGFITLF
jgi:outer membrane protein assembly factor BamA